MADKSLAELEAAVRDAMIALTHAVADVRDGWAGIAFMEERRDAYAAAVRALTWAKAREAVEGRIYRTKFVVNTDDTVRYIGEHAEHNNALLDALTALRDAQERDK